jgi:hypothetical protein
LLLAGCAGEPAQTAPAAAPNAEASGAERTGAAPSPAETTPAPLPEPLEATFSLPLRVPLSALAARIERELPQHHVQDWQDLTRPGKSPALQARYELWRDPLRLRFADSTLHVEVPLRYAARFNARVKNPFGGKWLTLVTDQPWGTQQQPQRVVLRIKSRVAITEDWELRLDSSVDEPDYGPPPEGSLCTGGSFKLCVSKASVAPEVRARLDAEILPRLRRGVAEIERRVIELVALRQRLEQAFRRLARPVAVGNHHFVRIEPRAAALELRGDAGDIVVEPALHARVSHHRAEPEAVALPPLPRRSPLSQLPGERIELPEAFVPAELGAALRGLETE